MQDQNQDTELTPDQVEEFRKKEIEYLTKILETLELRASVAQKKAALAEYTYKEAQYYRLLGDMKPQDVMDHTVTKEDLENNPELVEHGVKEGEIIQIPITNSNASKSSTKETESKPV